MPRKSKTQKETPPPPQRKTRRGTSINIIKPTAAAAKQKPIKKPKKIKDKNAPKRPMSSFFCFLKQKREEIKQTNPSLSNKEIVAVSIRENKSSGGHCCLEEARL